MKKQPLIRITKEFKFEMAHALVGYDGPCRNIHGFEQIIFLPYQPTSELMVADFAERIKALLPENIMLKHLLLRETVTSYAEWFAEDNL